MNQSRWTTRTFVSIIVCALVSCSTPAPTSTPTVFIEPIEILPSVTPSPTPLPPPTITSITVDGNGSDWESYQNTGGSLPTGNSLGQLDLVGAYVFVNRHALYLRALVADPTAAFVQIDITVGTDKGKFLLTWKPQGGSSAFMGETTSGYKALGPTRYSAFSLGSEFEARIDLRDLRSPKNIQLLAMDVWDGTCCESSTWNRIDQWNPGETIVLDEFDPPWTMNPADKEAIEALFPEGIPGMDIFLPYEYASIDPLDRMSKIVRTTQAHHLPQGYWVEPIFEPEIPGVFSVGIDGAGNMFVASGGAAPTLYLVNRESGEPTRLFGLSGNIHWSGLIGDPSGSGVWAGVNGDIYFIHPDGKTDTWLANAQGVPMALGPDGALYGVGFDGKVSRFTKSGREVLNERVFQRTGEMSVAVGPDGIVYIGDSDRGAVWQLDPSGGMIALVSSGLPAGDPVPLEIAADGTLYSAGSPYSVFKIDTQTGILSPLEGIGFTQHLINFSIDPQSDLLYFADPTYSLVVEIDPMTSMTRFIIEGGGNTPAMTLGQNGTLYFADSTRLPVEPALLYALEPSGSLNVLAQFDEPVMSIDMGIDDKIYVLTFVPGIPTVLSVDPVSGAIETVKRWTPDERTIFTMSVHSLSGEILLFDSNTSRLLSLSTEGEVSELPIRFDVKESRVMLDVAHDGILNMLASHEVSSAGDTTTFRTFYRSPDLVSLEWLADFHHKGCCAIGTLATAPDGSLYVTGVPLEGLAFSLWHVLPDGEMIQLSNTLNVDPLSILVAPSGDIFYTSVDGVFRIWNTGSQ